MDTDTMLERRFAELVDPAPRTSAAQIRQMAERRRRSRGRVRLLAAAAVVAAGGVAVGLAALFGTGGDAPATGRWRGVAGMDDRVELGVAVEGAQGLTARGAASVRAGERVLFHVRVGRDGYLCLDERDGDHWAAVYPVGGEAWAVSAGRHWPGGDQPLAFRTDLGAGTREYRVRFDPTAADCSSPTAEDRVVIHWEGARP